MSLQGILLVDLIGLALIVLMINLLRTHRLNVGYSLTWIAATLASMVIVSVPSLLDLLPRLVGAEYPASALSLLAFLFIFLVLIFMSVRLSHLSARQIELVQMLSIDRVDDQPDHPRSDGVTEDE
ncbi:MAG: DUF2304 domain-containing protein [Rhodothermales bacterium]|nr:DUF2304 domain-containing protein [Rhodothermales bacterium]